MSTAPMPGAMASQGRHEPEWPLEEVLEEVPLEGVTGDQLEVAVEGVSGDQLEVAVEELEVEGPVERAADAFSGQPEQPEQRGAGGRQQALPEIFQLVAQGQGQMPVAPEPTGARYFRLLNMADEDLTRQERADLNQILLTKVLRNMSTPK